MSGLLKSQIDSIWKPAEWRHTHWSTTVWRNAHWNTAVRGTVLLAWINWHYWNAALLFWLATSALSTTHFLLVHIIYIL
ncbi:hypothetical protein BpHYR1_008055 [Brachionus plicatilis]|uniref:Uncharacterized protein n=1 Tax=Brachionus plicatilis TaxID=10195 RepID=A0A3M7T3L0_BRAPC|nr:hypothetical protein BpHYR1_008055 [Brachionus plicatilis]